MQLVVSPLFRLVNKTNPTLAEVGTAEGVVESVGPFITGEAEGWAGASAGGPWRVGGCLVMPAWCAA